MNVSIATLAEDVGTDVTGIQTAITLYMLVMASLTITGGKVGAIMGRKRAFALGCVIYGAGSMTTALSQSLPVLMLGWSLLEGIGAALILPSIVALVATNFGPTERPRAYGLVAAAGAVAVAAGPLIGGLATTYASWRWVFAGEVVLVVIILLLTRRMVDGDRDPDARLDVMGTVLSALGLGLIVFGILKAGSWGFVNPKPNAPSWAGLSPVVWLELAGVVVLWCFFAWERSRIALGRSALLDPAILKVASLRNGVIAFFFQFLIQAGLFFCVPLYLSVALGLSAIDTGLRIMPLSVTLLIAAVGIPRAFPNASPRRVVRLGFLSLLVGLVSLTAALEVGVGAEIVTVPMLVAGFGIGALASQLGAVTVSGVPDEQSGEVGGIQNTFTNLGGSIGTALAGAVLISALSSSFFSGLAENDAVPDSVAQQAQVQLSAGVPLVSDAQLETALADAGVDEVTAAAIAEENAKARLDGLRSALAVLALAAVIAFFTSGSLPTRQPTGVQPGTEPDEVAAPGDGTQPEGVPGSRPAGVACAATPALNPPGAH
jgi:MFS family permease